jgi:biotin carboxyl carrier protein
MTFEVEVAGRMRTVSIARTDRPGHFRILVDGEAHLVDATRRGEFGLSLLTATPAVAVPLSGRGRPEKVTVPHSIHITPGRLPGELLVNMGGRVTAVRINGRRRGHAAEAGTLAHGEVPILAPMPGRIVRVLVAAGDQVATRQAIVVVEAMKMENELRASTAAIVRAIPITAGSAVEKGAVLMEFEPVR